LSELRRGSAQPLLIRHIGWMTVSFLGLMLVLCFGAAEAQSTAGVAIVEPSEPLSPNTELAEFYSEDVDPGTKASRLYYLWFADAPSSNRTPETGYVPAEDFSPGPRAITEAANSDFPSAPIRVDLAPVLAHLGQTVGDSQPVPSLEGKAQHYHWKGLLLQSLFFMGTEEVFRLISDQTMRTLTVDKPYWHDYIASLKQWNMRRWSDGDDFLVDDIGHPMQGGVSSFIEIQNDPRARNLRIGRSRAYWKSRFMGLMWATVFSTQQKIGLLGEAALGSDGGYTYVQGCKVPCPSYVPGVTKYTNNTGWTDFIMTPVAGSLWVLMEDTIDRFINDPIQQGRPEAVFPKVLRSGLNPCRSWANMMRLKKPWYRDFQHPETFSESGVHFITENEELLRRAPRFEIFPHLNALSLPVNTAQRSSCRRSLTRGAGVGFSYRILRWLDFDSDISHQPDASPLPSDRAGGNMIIGTFGFRTGIQTPHYALKIALRPGFASYDRAYLTSPTGIHLSGITGPVAIPPTSSTPEVGRITHFATALSINADFGLTRHFAVRAAFGNTPVRYKTDYYDRPPGRGSPPYLFFISPDIYATNENWNYQFGPVLRF